MLRFHSDRKQVFECKIKLEGANLKEASARLVLQDGNVNHIYEGKIDVLGKCQVQMPALYDFKKSKGKATVEIRVNDVVLEPYRDEYLIEQHQAVVSEAKVFEESKQQLFTKNISIPDKKLVGELIGKFNKLPKKHKKTLKEYVESEYKPSVKVRIWAKRRFNDINTIQAKMVMYQVENILQ